MGVLKDRQEEQESNVSHRHCFFIVKYTHIQTSGSGLFWWFQNRIWMNPVLMTRRGPGRAFPPFPWLLVWAVGGMDSINSSRADLIQEVVWSNAPGNTRYTIHTVAWQGCRKTYKITF